MMGASFVSTQLLRSLALLLSQLQEPVLMADEPGAAEGGGGTEVVALVVTAERLR